tara:strand:+ start:301 stop:585 length:285 start_codon:yes stop_codon:yes gene_type:complete
MERDVLVTNHERTSACNLVANGRFQPDISSACSKTDEASSESHIVWETYAPIMHTSYGGEYREEGSMVLWSAKGYGKQYPMDDMISKQRTPFIL